MRAVLLVVAVWIALRLSTDPADWTRTAEHVLLIALIITVAWLVGSLAFVLEDAALQRYRIDVADNRHARRIRTQVQVLRRITVAVLVLCAIAAILLTFPSARALGASLLASAGLISIVAGLAAQSSPGQRVRRPAAGVHRRDPGGRRGGRRDEWGRIEEITLTYVVVHVWDDRRLILPSTYFTTTPFENWTRRAADLLGTVELDLDWEVPVEAMRAELTRLLRGHRPVGRPRRHPAGHRRGRRRGPHPRAGERGRRPHPVRPALLRPRGAGRLAAARGAAEPAPDAMGGFSADSADGPRLGAAGPPFVRTRRPTPTLPVPPVPAGPGRLVAGRHADHQHRWPGRRGCSRAASRRWSGRDTSPGPGRTSSTSASSPPTSTGRGGSPDPARHARRCWSTGWSQLVGRSRRHGSG